MGETIVFLATEEARKRAAEAPPEARERKRHACKSGACAVQQMKGQAAPEQETGPAGGDSQEPAV